jgi:hypothetical protein
MNSIPQKLPIFLLLLCSAVIAQAQSNQGVKTFSPYTPEQLKAFNDQKISPAEGPFGPVDPNQQQMNLQKKPPVDSKFFNVSVGEQEAEAIETESADPYQPMTPAIAF